MEGRALDDSNSYTHFSDHPSSVAALLLEELCNGCLVQRKTVEAAWTEVAANASSRPEPAREQCSARWGADAGTDVEVGETQALLC